MFLKRLNYMKEVEFRMRHRLNNFKGITYEPQNRLIKINNKQYYLAFPYLTFFVVHNGFRCIATLKPFDEVNKNKYYLLNLPNINEFGGVCQTERNNLEDSIKTFWFSAFKTTDIYFGPGTHLERLQQFQSNLIEWKEKTKQYGNFLNIPRNKNLLITDDKFCCLRNYF